MSEDKHISLSQFLGDIRDVLANNFTLSRWVCAEISELKINRHSGHCYLELVENGGDNGVPKAKVSATIWRNTWNIIEPYFLSATNQNLSVGMGVLLKVSVNFHELYGFSLQISDINPLYTLGEQEQQRLQTISQLKIDGVFGLNGELPFPVVPQRIAVISSSNAAGFQDFNNELEHSGYSFSVELFSAIMQGNDAEDSIIDALERVAEKSGEYEKQIKLEGIEKSKKSERFNKIDVVVIIRGGGSQSDLSCFNSYALCSNIAQFPLPILTGIGHDKDQSVADMVAFGTLKTPTAVATFLVQRAAIFENKLDDYANRLHSEVTKIVDGHKNRLSTTLMVMRLGVENFIFRHKQRLENALALVSSSDPKRILALGFAVVRVDGKAVKDVKQLNKGQMIDIELNNGMVKAKIDEKGD